jgi:hypothetical protein
LGVSNCSSSCSHFASGSARVTPWAAPRHAASPRGGSPLRTTGLIERSTVEVPAGGAAGRARLRVL